VSLTHLFGETTPTADISQRWASATHVSAQHLRRRATLFTQARTALAANTATLKNRPQALLVGLQSRSLRTVRADGHRSLITQGSRAAHHERHVHTTDTHTRPEHATHGLAWDNPAPRNIRHRRNDIARGDEVNTTGGGVRCPAREVTASKQRGLTTLRIDRLASHPSGHGHVHEPATRSQSTRADRTFTPSGSAAFARLAGCRQSVPRRQRAAVSRTVNHACTPVVSAVDLLGREVRPPPPIGHQSAQTRLRPELALCHARPSSRGFIAPVSRATRRDRVSQRWRSSSHPTGAPPVAAGTACHSRPEPRDRTRDAHSVRGSAH